MVQDAPMRRMAVAVAMVLCVLTTGSHFSSAATPEEVGCGPGHANVHPITRGVVSELMATVTSRDNVIVGYVAPHGATHAPLTLYDLGPHCLLDRAFGTRGVIRPRLPLGEPGSDVVGVEPSLDGGFFVLENDHRSWWVGEFHGDGAVDRSFGKSGWVALLAPGGSSYFWPSLRDVVQASDGMIYVAGNNAQSHAGTHGYVAALFPNGTLDTAFGARGFAEVLPQMTWVGQLFLQSGGEIAVSGWLGGGGCGEMPIAWIFTSGVPQRWIDADYDSAHSFPLKSCFSGSVFADADGGVGVAGTNYSLQGRSSKPPYLVRMESLTQSGSIDRSFGDSGSTAYHIPWVDAAATTQYGDVVLLGIQGRRLTLLDFRANGKLIAGFGRNGVVYLPYDGSSDNFAFLNGPRNDVTLVVESQHSIIVRELAA